MLRFNSFWSVLFLFVSFTAAHAQSTYLPYNAAAYNAFDRYEVLSGRIDPSVHTSQKPYSREYIIRYIDSLPAQALTSRADSFNIQFHQIDSWEWSGKPVAESQKPFLKHFYRYKADAYSVNIKDFDLHVNPVLYFAAGNKAGNPTANYTFLNTRGIELRGRIAQRVGFYSLITDNQGAFPNYVNDRVVYNTPDSSATPVVPYEAFAKTFKTNGYDFITARGYITFELVKKYIDLQFGYDKNFIGNGYRSLILSDIGGPYTFMKLNTHIWKFNYQNLFTQMTAQTGDAGLLYPKKYMALHHLSLNVTKNLNIGIFESIVFGRADSLKQGTFDIAYLNPILFYRSIEQSNGSKDNSFLGIDFKYNFLKHFSAYGQLVLDEFSITEIRSGNGWWANKQAIQLGLKYFNAFGIKNLDLQGETNIVRPYMYSHADYYTSYTHYNQPLAHPMGANFKEVIGIVRYQPVPKLMVQTKLFYTMWGDDSTTTKNDLNNNNGGNIYKSYYSVAVPNTYGNTIGQGVKTNIAIATLQLSYQVRHNLFLDFTWLYRKQDSEMESKSSSTNYVSAGVRLNIVPRNYEF